MLANTWLSRALVAAFMTLTLTLTMSVAAQAQTDPSARFPASGFHMRAATAVAAAQWGQNPCQGQVKLSWQAMDIGLEAQAQWLAPDISDIKDPSSWMGCEIVFNSSAGYSFVKLCSVLVHEMGHLLGREHTGARGIMAERYSRPAASCRKKRSAIAASRR